jgi:hypothetical protein
MIKHQCERIRLFPEILALDLAILEERAVTAKSETTSRHIDRRPRDRPIWVCDISVTLVLCGALSK